LTLSTLHSPRRFAAFCLFAAALAAQQPIRLTVGVYSFKRPTEVAKEFFVATDELARLMTQQCGRTVTIDLRVYKTYDECLDKFVGGDVDIVRFGPASYVLAKQRNPAIELLVAEQEQERDQKGAEGIIAVRRDSPIKTLADLKGKSFAFGDENSTIGRYLSQAELVRAGVLANDLKRFQYLDRHDKVFKAVEVGDFDAGALHVSTFECMNGEKKPLRELAHFENIGKPWVARAKLDTEIVVALRKSLLEMSNSPEPLKALKIHGFLPTSDEKFMMVREGMKTAARFEPPTTPEPDHTPPPDATPPKPNKD
jgi:phosphonate transport system substrate-binding protein